VCDPFALCVGRYANPTATDDEVRRAADIANASSFIEHFPDGYKTLVSAVDAACFPHCFIFCCFGIPLELFLANLCRGVV
jgi:hypothetical protein